MIEVTLNKEELRLGALLGTDRMLEVLKPKHIALWGRNINGCLAEIAVAKALDVQFIPTINTFHEVSDLPGGIEVRWTKHRNGSLLVRTNDVLDRRYVLVLGQAPTFIVAGWAWGHEVADQGNEVTEYNERRHVWGMPIERLQPIETLNLKEERIKYDEAV